MRLLHALLTIAVVVALSIPALATAQAYRWVDKDGNVHYSQTPPAVAEPEPPTEPTPPATVPRKTSPSSKTVAPAAPAKERSASATSSPYASLVGIPLGAPPTEPVARARYLLDNRPWDAAADREAAAEIAKALKADPKNAMALAQAARITYFAGDRGDGRYDPKALERAMTLVDRALAADPRLPEAHVGRGYILLFRKDSAGARQAAFNAEKLRPGDQWANELLTDIAIREKKYDEAHDRAQTRLRLAKTRKEQVSALQDLTTVFKARRDIANADQAYTALLRLAPESPWVRINYVWFLTSMANEHERAVRLAQEALRLMDFPRGHQMLAGAAYNRGNEIVEKEQDWVRAGDYYAIAVEHNPRDADAHYGLGMAYWAKASQTRDKTLLDKAGSELQTALKINPKHEQARRNYDDLVHRGGWKPPR